VLTFSIVRAAFLLFMALIETTTTRRAEAIANADVTDKTRLVLDLLDNVDLSLRKELDA
jgi:hypothetical protein